MPALGRAAPAQTPPSSEPVFSCDLFIDGATTGGGGQLFVLVQPQRPGAGPEVIEVKDGKSMPFPDQHWNGWRPGINGSDHVRVWSIRLAPGERRGFHHHVLDDF